MSLPRNPSFERLAAGSFNKIGEGIVFADFDPNDDQASSLRRFFQEAQHAQPARGSLVTHSVMIKASSMPVQLIV
jgi:hypothetical protein